MIFSLAVFAQEFFLGDDLIPWLLLALGGALVAGTAMALVRPPRDEEGGPTGTPERPPWGRSLVMITLGVLIAGWALASLVRG